jgi:hypothetical protein
MSAGDPMSAFLGTYNRLSATPTAQTVDADQAQRVVLEALKERPAGFKTLSELPMPMSAVESAVQTLQHLGMIEADTAGDGTVIFKLTDYAAKALIYLTPM